MDVERTIEFLLKNQARMDARFDGKFDKADQRFAQAEKRLDRLERGLAENSRVVAQNNRIVAQLARSGVALRSDVRRTERNLAEITESLAEMDGKLNALIDFVDRQTRGNGRQR
jgi:septal ring factor EnvC (AmiA/AmiB activator)